MKADIRTGRHQSLLRRATLPAAIAIALFLALGCTLLPGSGDSGTSGGESENGADTGSANAEQARRSASRAVEELEEGDGDGVGSAPDSRTEEGPKGFEVPVATGQAPQWVKNRPSEPGFFYGLGRAEASSDRENPMAEARSRALADLASQLSAEVEEQIRIEKSESSDGESFSFVQMESDTEVDLRLPELDVVKSYRGDDETSWYLVGLSFNTWQDWLHPEQASARRQVLDTVRYADSASYGERLQKIQNALAVLDDEPSGEKMQGSLWGEQGNLESILLNRYVSLLGEMELEGLENTTVSDKEVPTVNGRVDPERNTSVGPLFVHLLDGEGNVSTVVPTAPDGSFSAQLPDVPAKGGSYGYKAVAKPFSAPAAPAFLEGALIPFPTFPFSIEVEESFVQLRVESNWRGDSSIDEVTNYLQQQLDVPIKPEESNAILTVDLSFRENDEGFGNVAVAFLSGVVRYRDEKREAVLWRSGEIRGYGTNTKYARRKAAEIFLEQLQENIDEVRRVEAMF